VRSEKWADYAVLLWEMALGTGGAKEASMITGIYQGAAAMNALERWQTAITGNLASGSVAGYKKDETSFSSALAGSTRLQPGDLSAEFQQYAPKATTRISDGQGAIRQTGKDTDLAIQGSGFFQVRTPEGQAYSRNGEFHVDSTGKLVNGQGLDVQSDAGPIQLDPKLGPVTINRTGQVSQGTTVLGKLLVMDLSKSGELQRSGSGLYVPADGSTPPRVENPEVMQGYIEESNVVPLQEMVNLIAVSRAYEVSQKLITSIDRTTGAAIETLGTP
jgi:flagellar basal body rod protein FlgG